MVETTNSDGSLKRYLILVWYIGTDFSGSQRQPNKRTVEGELLRALIATKYISDPVSGNFKAAARTDAGVHALEAGFCFNTSKPFHIRQLDSYLAQDLGVHAWVEVPLEFYPRWEVDWKEYRYVYWKSSENASALNFPLMVEAMHLFEGTHDFRLFMKTDLSKKSKQTEMCMERALLEEKDGCLLFTFRSRFFLWQQIRRMVSFLLKVGKTNRTLADLTLQLTPDHPQNTSARRDPPHTPGGLTLWITHFADVSPFHIDERCSYRRQVSFRSYAQTLFQRAQSLQYMFDLGDGL
jgi:tRNA pseudouridine38-40 synthase